MQVKFTGKGQIVGASTITQQVAKNFLLTNERSIERKLKEALLVQRIEQTFSKDQILELYLNEIFLGLNSYGVAAASLNYFGKSLDELSLEELAYLAALPKGPNNYHPFRQKERAIERRNWVLLQMFENGYITEEEMKQAQAKPLEVNPRPFGAQLFAAESFAEEVRRELIEIYGKDKLEKGGLSVRTTLDPKLQLYARQALARGLIGLDRKRGFRGPVATRELGAESDWGMLLKDRKVPADVAPWRLAVVLDANDTEALIGLQPKAMPDGKLAPERRDRQDPARPSQMGARLCRWLEARPRSEEGRRRAEARRHRLCGALARIRGSGTSCRCRTSKAPSSPWTRTRAACWPWSAASPMAGASSTARSRRCASRAPPSSPSSMRRPSTTAIRPPPWCSTRPIEFKMADGSMWKPKNYQNKFFGPSTLRRGIEQSRNVMTVRLADDLGMTKIADLAQRLGIYDKLPRQLAMALGAGETTLLRMVTAYAIIDNGGKKIEPTLIDRIQDRYGRPSSAMTSATARAAAAEAWNAGMPEPELLDVREQVMSPYTAYQITSMMEGVVERGTGKKMKIVGKPVAGKTGTSNDERDAWFIGYTPDLVVGVYHRLRQSEAHGQAAAPAANWRPPSWRTSCAWRCATSRQRPSACRAPSS